MKHRRFTPAGRILAVACFLFSLQFGFAQEFRALWVDAFGAGIKDSNQVTALVNNARAGNFNAVIVQVRKRGDAYYNSNFEPKATDISPASFDPLQDLINKAHNTSNGPRIEVHAWIVVYPISQSPSPGANHPMTLHPDWLSLTESGANFDSNDNNRWFEQAHPGVQQHTFNVAMDIVSRYNIDGLNFDYVRYNGRAWGYNPVAVERFNTQYNRSGQPGQTDAAWMQFRRDQVTGLVRKIYLHTIAIKPHVKVSVDAICFAPGITTTSQWTSSSAYAHKFQDWRAWMQEGMIDLNIPMMYFDQTISSHVSAWNNWSIFSKNHRYNRHLAIGPGVYRNSISNSIHQIRTTRQATSAGNRADGVSLYAYKLTSNDGLSRATFLNALTSPSVHDSNPTPVFSTFVQPPDMPWKTAPTRGHIKGFVLNAAGSTGLDGARVILTGPASRTQTNDATGCYGFVDLVPGTYNLTATLAGYTTNSAPVAVTAGTVATRDITLEKLAPPTIINQPQSQSALLGSSVTFSVTAVGVPAPTYQWRFNGTNIAGATASNFTRANVSSSHEGAYSVVLLNSQGSATSSNAMLTVTTTAAPPLITSQPQGQTAIAGSDVVLSVSAEGTSPLLYQWKRNNVNISGATHPSLNLNNVQAGNAGTYTVAITNNFGGLISSPAVLAVHYTLNVASTAGGSVAITPNQATYAPNSTVNLTATAVPGYAFTGWSGDSTSKATSINVTMNGNKSFTAAFTNEVIVESRLQGGALNSNPPYSDSGFANSTLKSAAPGLSGTGSRYASSGTPSFTIKPALNVPGGVYDVYLTHGSASSVSSDIVVAVTQSGCTGLPTTTEIFRAPGANTWEFLGTMTLNAGVSIPTLTFTRSSGALTGSSRMYSDSIRFVYRGPAILSQPQSTNVVQGQSATFRVTAAGPTPRTFQWRFMGNTIAGATQSAYTRGNAQASHAGQYSVVVSNPNGTMISSNATLTVVNPPSITAHPQSQTVNQGGSAAFAVTATGTAPLFYQWRHNGAPINNATGSSHAIAQAQAGDAGSYSVVVSNSVSTATSANAVLTVQTPPEIILHPHDQDVLIGSNVTFTVSATGTAPLSYLWHRDNVSIGATGSALTLTGAQESHAGVYSVLVTNSLGTATSDPALLTVIVPLSITTQPESQTVKAGTNVTFNVIATGTEPIEYQWWFGETTIEDANENSHTISNVSTNDAGAYFVLIKNPAGTIASSHAMLTVEPAIAFQIESLEILSGSEVRLILTGEQGSNYVIQASSNLLNWLDLTNILNTNAGTFEFVDSNATNQPLRFYRMQSP